MGGGGVPLQTARRIFSTPDISPVQGCCGGHLPVNRVPVRCSGGLPPGACLPFLLLSLCGVEHAVRLCSKTTTLRPPVEGWERLGFRNKHGLLRRWPHIVLQSCERNHARTGAASNRWISYLVLMTRYFSIGRVEGSSSCRICRWRFRVALNTCPKSAKD